MDKYSIDLLLAKISDSYLIISGVVIFFSTKFLSYCGRKIAEGANEDFIKKFEPTIEKYIDKQLKLFTAKLSADLSEVKESINSYKAAKHNIETENKYLKQAIKEDDQELLEVIKQHLNEKK